MSQNYFFTVVTALVTTGVLATVSLSAGAQQTSAAQASPPAEAVVRFRLVDITLVGATLLKEEQWRPAIAALAGQDISFAQLEAARAAIEAVFHAQGWRLATVRIPAQSLTDGIVRMQAIEPRLKSVSVKRGGALGADGTLDWRTTLPALFEGSTPNLNALDRQLLLANENSARRVQVTFAAAGAPNELSAEIQTNEAVPTSITAFVDNTGSVQTGRLRYGLAWRHNNLWDLGHQLNVQATSAPHNKDEPHKLSLLPSSNVQVFGLGYRAPLPQQAAMVDVNLGYSNVDSGILNGVFNVAGKGSTAALKYTQLLERTGRWEPRWFAGLDRRHYDSQLLFGSVNLATPIELRPLQLGFSVNMAPTPQQPLAVNVYASLHANLPGGAAGDQASFTSTRQGAPARYKLLRAGLGTQVPAGNWQLSATLDAQISRDMLVSGEQLAAGGATSVRGFSNRGISGDSGLRVQLEATGPNWLGEDTQGTDRTSLRGVAFIDAAATRLNQPAVLELASASIASAGVGLRGTFGPATLRLDVAKALRQRNGAAPVWGAVHFSALVNF